MKINVLNVYQIKNNAYNLLNYQINISNLKYYIRIHRHQ
jgi:hypothetical protein